ncbi:hypothetical protein ES332_A04G123700v1 [Gossypium tomentosum]|uniref:6-phosphogluconate dehydrogenase NADP-binding domain-containing protein n=1 Tax=Gossypium tomentosum TaxID=34277 RepID=A0A5D2QXC8_GOSTO|nr:hypothetical protein ES332_A04G123700v1 [Gossypium tomentosum]
MLLLLICRGAFLIMLEMAMAMTRKMLLGFWRPMGILNPNSKGKNELYRGVVAAEAGSLTFMVGGSEDVYLAAKSLLLSMGKEELQEAIDFISLFG